VVCNYRDGSFLGGVGSPESDLSVTDDPPEALVPKFGPDGAPALTVVRAFERRYVLAAAVGREGQAAADGRFLAIWRRLVSPELLLRVGGMPFTVGWRLIEPTSEELEAAAFWVALETHWPV
jgi:hypothetical protein